jgi:hypothetical protein
MENSCNKNFKTILNFYKVFLFILLVCLLKHYLLLH